MASVHDIPWIAGVLALSLAGTAMAQGEGHGGSWQDRSHWDWGQHRMGLAGEAPAPAGEPVQVIDDHWDYPGAPVRFAGHTLRG